MEAGGYIGVTPALGRWRQDQEFGVTLVLTVKQVEANLGNMTLHL